MITLLESPEEFHLSMDPVYYEFMTDLVAGGQANEPNLTAYIEVFDIGETETILALHSPYDLDTAKTDLDIHRVFTLEPHLPEEDQIPLGITPGVFLAPKAHKSYRVLYSDKFGSPPSVEGLQDGPNRFVIYGGLPFDHRATWGDAGSDGILCHDYGTRPKTGMFVKPVSPDQPQWLYLFTKAVIEPEFKITYFFKNGNSTEQILNIEDTLDQKKMYYLPVGYNQIGLNEDPEDLAAYSVSLRNTLKDDEVFSVKYLLDCSCHPWEFFILAFNGLGGLESVRMKGKVEESLEVEGELFETYRWKDSSPAAGLENSFNKTASRPFKASTGWYSEQYIDHLKILLLGETWLIDTQNARFLRINILTSRVVVHKTDQQLFKMDLEFQLAWRDSVQSSK